jgi:hypothetical protein
MENKKTTELLDLLNKITKDGTWNDEATKVSDELKSREPFYTLLNPRNGITISDELDILEEDIKKLKRHKHDEKNGDVLIRI